MAKTKKRNKACDGKVRFNSLKEAQDSLYGMKRRKDKQGKQIVSVLRAYGCSCGGFHYGKTGKIDWSKVN